MCFKTTLVNNQYCDFEPWGRTKRGGREVVEKIRLPHFELNPKKQFENMRTATHRDKEKERGGRGHTEREREAFNKIRLSQSRHQYMSLDLSKTLIECFPIL